MAYTRLHSRRVSLGATEVDTAAPQPGRPQPPIFPLRVGAHGGYLEVRSSPSDGSCGVSGYPCQHPGVDVAGSAGTPVVAPETGTIVMAGDGAAAPFVGYGPWFVLLQGLQSGKFHLLAHLEPLAAAMAPVGAEVVAGQRVGATSSADHTHWEVRSKPVPEAGESNRSNNTDPLGWLSTAALGVGAVLLFGGAAVLAVLIARRRRS